jgi:hypothetical protein
VPSSVPPLSADTLWVSLLSTSVSFVSRLPVTVFGSASSVTAATSATATGASLVPVTVSVRVDALEPP